MVIGFLLWGLAIGQLYQDLYARVWRIHVGSAADQALFAIWFFVASALVGLMMAFAADLRSDGWLVLIPAWIAGSTIFWLWTPRFLLHRKIALRSLLPGALLASFVLGGTIATSPLWIGPTVNQDARAFSSFGAVIALFAYILICITISMVCAVFSPVWAEWREAERDRKEHAAQRRAGHAAHGHWSRADRLDCRERSIRQLIDSPPPIQVSDLILPSQRSAGSRRRLRPAGLAPTGPDRRKRAICRYFRRVSEGTRTPDRLDHNRGTRSAGGAGNRLGCWDSAPPSLAARPAIRHDWAGFRQQDRGCCPMTGPP